MRVPIACNLTQAAASAQVGEWRALLPASVKASERASPGELSFVLNDDLGELGALVRLAQREKACCPFFDFALLIGPDDVVFSVKVPADASALLDDFARIAGPLPPRALPSGAA